MAQVEERVSDLEKLMQQLTLNVKQVSDDIDKTQQELSESIKQMSERMDRTQRELSESIDRTQRELSESIDRTQRKLSERIDQVTKNFERFQEEMKEFKVDINKKWGELANRLGTLAEDLIAPNLPGLIKKEFRFDEPHFLGLRLRRRSKEHNIRGEVDCLLEYDEHVFICEVKSQSSKKSIHGFKTFVDQKFPMLFPEYATKTVVPVYAAISFDPNHVIEATNLQILAIRILGDILSFLNLDDLKKQYFG